MPLQPMPFTSRQARHPSFDKFRHKPSAPWLFALLVLILALSATWWLASRTKQQEIATLEAEFNFRVRETVAQIERRLTAYEQALRAVQAYFHSSAQIRPEELRTYVDSLGLQQSHPGIQAIALSPLIPRDRLASHIAAKRAQGMRDYAVRPPGPRPFYAPITQVEPKTDHNQRVLGFDMLAEPLRQAAMIRARDAGEAAATGKLVLLEEPGIAKENGFLIYLPLYDKDMPTNSPSARQAALTGWISGAIRMQELMATIGGERASDTHIEVHDGAIASEAALFYSESAPEIGRPHAPLFMTERQLEVAGQPWTIVIRSTPVFEASLASGRSGFIAAAGSGIGVLLAVLVWLLATSRVRALRIAANMTEELQENRKWLNLALDAAQLGVVDWDLKNDIAIRSARHDHIFGHVQPVAEWRLQTYLDHVLPQDREPLKRKLRACWVNGTIDIAFRIVLPCGQIRWVAAKGTVQYDRAGEPARHIGTIADITELKTAEEQARRARAELEARVQQRTAALVQSNELLMTEIQEREKVEEALFNSRRRLSLIFDTVAEGLVVHDQDGRVVERNAAATRILGLPRAQHPDSQLQINELRVIHEDGSPFPTDSHPAYESLRTGRPMRDVVMGIYKPDGQLAWISVSTEPLVDAAGHVQMVVVNFSDITRKKASEELIWKQANFDSLTGLPNRRLFQDHLEQEIKKASRNGLPLALMFLDLDHFKDINDTLGHDKGDMLLREAAQRLSACVRDSDTVARLGGDEFTVILGALQDVTDVVRIAQHIRQKIAEPFMLGMQTVHVSASIGITLYPDDASNIDTLLKNADQAMYAAKNQGRNRYQYFTKSMQDVAQARMWLANELRSAVAGRHFHMVYQPIVDLATGGIVKAEALIRWQHPTRGAIDPAVFIPIAEETGLIIEIGNWALHVVADQAKQWRAVHDPAFQISVNNSPMQFQSNKNDYASWLNYLKHIDLPGQGIALEITEGLLLDASSDVSDLLLSFRDAGVHVSLDDFGTGYSSLAYLKKFDIDMLKIDKSFVQNLAPDSEDMALCEAIIVMAHKLNVKVVAEGVETAQQRDLLASAGCDYAQGFLFAYPVAAEDFLV